MIRGVTGLLPGSRGGVRPLAQGLYRPRHPRTPRLVLMAPPLCLVSCRVVLPHVTLYCLVIQSTPHGLDVLFAVTPLDSRLQARDHGALTGELCFQSLNATVQALVLCLQTVGLG